MPRNRSGQDDRRTSTLSRTGVSSGTGASRRRPGRRAHSSMSGTLANSHGVLPPLSNTLHREFPLLSTTIQKHDRHSVHIASSTTIPYLQPVRNPLLYPFHRSQSSSGVGKGHGDDQLAHELHAYSAQHQASCAMCQQNAYHTLEQSERRLRVSEKERRQRIATQERSERDALFRQYMAIHVPVRSLVNLQTQRKVRELEAARDLSELFSMEIVERDARIALDAEIQRVYRAILKCCQRQGKEVEALMAQRAEEERLLAVKAESDRQERIRHFHAEVHRRTVHRLHLLEEEEAVGRCGVGSSERREWLQLLFKCKELGERVAFETQRREKTRRAEERRDLENEARMQKQRIEDEDRHARQQLRVLVAQSKLHHIRRMIVRETAAVEARETVCRAAREHTLLREFIWQYLRAVEAKESVVRKRISQHARFMLKRLHATRANPSVPFRIPTDVAYLKQIIAMSGMDTSFEMPRSPSESGGTPTSTMASRRASLALGAPGLGSGFHIPHRDSMLSLLLECAAEEHKDIIPQRGSAPFVAVKVDAHRRKVLRDMFDFEGKFRREIEVEEDQAGAKLHDAIHIVLQRARRK